MTPVSDELLPQPSTLKSALLRLIRTRGLAGRSASENLDTEWKRIVGTELGRWSTARRVKGGVLEVAVTNSAALEELRGFLHDTVLQQMQICLPQSDIRTIRYVRVR